MVNFAELKKKAEETAKNAGSSSKGTKGPPPPKPVKYVPVRPGEVALGKLPSLEERRAQSSVLNMPGAAPLPPPPPPPIRRGTAESASRSSEPVPPPVSTYGRNTAVSAKQAAPPAPPPRSVPTIGPSVSPGYGDLGDRKSRSSVAPPPPARRTYQSPTDAESSPNPLRQDTRNELSSTRTSIFTPTHAILKEKSAPYKKFSEYDAEDRESLFGMLDDFFSSKHMTDPLAESNGLFADSMANSNADSTEPAPPQLTLFTKPNGIPYEDKGAILSSLTQNASYPYRDSHSSSALSILHYLLYAEYPPWYAAAEPGAPPPLVTRSDIRRSGAWTQTGTNKALMGVALFGDASIAWWKLSWSVRNENTLTSREGRYRPVPEAWDGAKLYAASELYGPLIVHFAQAAVAQRKPVARGECWDMAAEALSSIEENRPDLPKPFPSISGTHGHCIFYAKAGGSTGGVWKGGDPYVRPGDIVQWASVTIREVGMSASSWSTLGDPDHTAVIIAAETPKSEPANGETFPISSLVSLTVIEQSQGELPAQKTYDMRAMSAGEVWIYRPVSLIDFVGADVEPLWPPPCDCYEIGQLE